jgi:adenine-specific DNA-methyltransferase
MRYFGSKASTTEQVYTIISSKIPMGTVCDPFGGIATIGSYFKSKGYSVWSGDLLTFAHYFQVARLEANKTPVFRRLRKAYDLGSLTDVIDYLNKESKQKGWFVEEYSKKRQFFTEKNAIQIEACKNKIEEWNSKKLLTQEEYAILISSLINSMDKVANTAGTYYAYLKQWHRKALHPFFFTLIPFTPGNNHCKCFLSEAQKLVSKCYFDILYLDPPYNERSYSHYYHLPETIALGLQPQLHGKSGMPNTKKVKSDFNRPQSAKKALEKILVNARFRLLAFHYADDGLIKQQEIVGILSKFGRIENHLLDTKGYVTSAIKRDVKQNLYLVSND